MNDRKRVIKEKIILPAWKLIKEDSNIKKFYLIPGVLSVIFLTGLLAYQAIYTFVRLGHNEEFFSSILNFFEIKYIVEVLISVGVFLVIYFFLSPIFEAGLIKYVELKDHGKTLSKSETFGQGIHKFLPMFEYSNFFSEFKLLSVMNFYLFTLRFVGIEYFTVINYFYLGVFILSLVINMLLIYSKYFLIIEDKSVFESIGDSIKLSIFNPIKTIRLFFMMFLLNIRIVINFLIFLFFPIFIGIALSLITTKFLLIITIITISIVFITLILFVGYLSSVLEIFKTALWYYAYKEGKGKIKYINEE